MRVLWLAVITSHEATVTVHQSKWREVMLQCHFLDLVLSKHFVVYESVRTTHLVFHPQLRVIRRTRLQCTAEHHQSLLVCRRCRCWYARHARHGAIPTWILLTSMENEVMAYLEASIIVLITGGISSLGTIAALKTDINWIKRVQQDQEQRIRKLEDPNG